MATLASIVLKYKGHLQSVGEKAVADLGSRIKEGTPKDSGDARKSWRESGHFKVGTTYLYTSKGIKYMGALEYGKKGITYEDGREAHSPQAPYGMIRINTAKWAEIVDKYVKAANR